MTNYIETSTNNYPLSERTIRSMHPKTTFPKPFKKYGYEVVFTKPKPECTMFQTAIESTPELTEKGTWEQCWSIIDKYCDIKDDDGTIIKTKDECEAEAIADKKKNIKKELSAFRYEKEVGGILLNGQPISTSREAQIAYSVACNKLKTLPDGSLIDWGDSATGTFITMDKDTLCTIEHAVWLHVQACRTREKELSQLIDVDINTDITIGWPAYV